MLAPLPKLPDFPKLEKKWLAKWQKDGIVSQYLQKNIQAKKHFSFFDGPITANNPMGVHHGWGRTYKDLWQRFYNLRGYQLRFQNGFDCQGLWVEVEVEKELGLKNKKEIENLVPNNKAASIAKFVDLCKERVRKYSAIQIKQSQRLGYFMDWKNSYYTMSAENNYMIWHFLKVCDQHGWIYKGKESVPWCPRCQTAISQHEMLTEDYKEVRHEAVYLKLPLVGKNEYLLVWTTTPWTIPANIAVAVDADLEYSLVSNEAENSFWVAKELTNKIFGDSKYQIIKTVKGKELVGLKYKGPFDSLPAVKKVALSEPEKFHSVVATDSRILPINLKEGTGLVHTAVSAGSEDFKLGKKLALPMIPVINDSADYLPGLGFLSGKNAKRNPRIILDYLLETEKNNDQSAWVFKIEKYKHRYPACWRCKAELVWKVADEWYIAMDKPSKTEVKKNNLTLRQRMIKVAKQIKWLPEFGLKRELDWLDQMHDWLISKKNRYWGLALPIYECKKCGFVQVIGSKEELKEKAVRGWEQFEKHTPHKPYIDEVEISCPKCGSIVKRVEDVGNPWLDAGIIPYSTLVDPKTKKVSYLHDKKYWQKWFPADFITESFPGQFKNWFYSLIAMSTVLEQKNPFKTVLGYATCVGADGRAMHKSWGNAIEFNEAAEKMGVDVMRWMYVKQNPSKNLLFGYEIGKESQRSFHIPLWNILKYYQLYLNLDNYQDKVVLQPSKLKLSLLDRWLLSRLKQTEEKVKQNLTNYQPALAAEAIENLVLDTSQWYLRLSRSRVWQNNTDKSDKQAFYSTLNYLLNNLTVIISIFLPFYSEEIFSYLQPKAVSVHLQSWPSISADWLNPELTNDMKIVRSLAEMGHKERKKEEIKVRQPLGEIVYQLQQDNLPKITANYQAYQLMLSSELNIKKIIFKQAKETAAILKTTLTPQLVWEGKIRDLIRKIQRERQKSNCSINEKIVLTIPEVPKQYLPFIKQKVLAKSINFSKKDTIEIKRE
jgi:isoleucyl-tRNA synthetase